MSLACVGGEWIELKAPKIKSLYCVSYGYEITRGDLLSLFFFWAHASL